MYVLHLLPHTQSEQASHNPQTIAGQLTYYDWAPLQYIVESDIHIEGPEKGVESVCCHIKHLNGPGAWVWSHSMAWRYDPSLNRTSTIDPMPPARLFLPTPHTHTKPRMKKGGREGGEQKSQARYGTALSDTHHHHHDHQYRNTTALLARCCPCRPCLALPNPLPYRPLDNAVLRRIGYTCLACPAPAMLVDVGPRPSVWQMPPPVNLVRGTTGGWRQRGAAAGSGWSSLCQGGHKLWKSLRVAYTTRYLRRLCDTRGTTEVVGRPCGSGTLHPVLCTNILPSAWVACDFDGRTYAFLLLPTTYLWIWGVPLLLLVPTRP